MPAARGASVAGRNAGETTTMTDHERERRIDALLEDAYNAAVDAGDFDETAEWVEQTTAARRRRRPGD